MKRAPVITLSGLVALVALVWLLIGHLDGNRMICRGMLPDGSEFCVLQRCNWSAEMFTTAFYHKPADGNWHWYYYSHQDTYWGGARIEFDTNAAVARIVRGETVAITFNWRLAEYRLYQGSFSGPRTGQPMPAGWTPESAGAPD